MEKFSKAMKKRERQNRLTLHLSDDELLYFDAANFN